MVASTANNTRRVLDPPERISEVLFGLIMVLAFTGSFSAAQAGRGEVRSMLFGAIGCNLAWGIVDATMYVITSIVARNRGAAMLNAVRGTTDPAQADRIVADALPPVLSSVLEPSDVGRIRHNLARLPEDSHPGRLTADDLSGAAAAFLLVFLSTFPVVIPFILIRSPFVALRISNLVAVTMLFLAGSALGRYSGCRALRMGLSMVAIGLVLVLIIVALGG
ncbi:MAG: VIT1/CCC1 transporter family protein [Verrucomicrobia bacterium]|nr:VIT1/CCC1 transporter family protein [Verrucomicrobiota bacterium]